MDRLSSPSATKRIVEKHGFKFSKSLGQNFLIDSNVVDNIVEGANIGPEDFVIEVGPGIGTLTREIAKRAKKVIAVEIDKSLIPILENTLSDLENVELINEDILKMDVKKVIDEKLEGKRVKLIANLPYYITTPIVMRFIEEEIPVSSIVVMIQKEVADRMNAVPSTKDYGSLSVAVQYYCETEIVTNVPKTVFIPQPKVDSTVIRLDVLENPKIKVVDKKLFFKVVKGAFSKRRKTILNCLGSYDMGVSKEDIKRILESAGIDPVRRGETLSIDEFARLSNEFYKFIRTEA
ncbi:dimethyladenosine transferase [Peptoclostridium litorale DSM 5388]|uniref:Ribosomal RNA small subunit methyltransferase A n=1 Tax=Peptoclostridium litorale DSM 5388 TaxID=1121324 RepID=A0A069RDF3_PEPLI|nr:16S rRNA (adenine(1518)-N(6)/adenine(1519)-N(6))-dimethyltransferase RsmA [Peptoclostridium litorale]KDR94250.1 ribosomal RNA small subunit methyltransferase A [Peptoclostridium litorale DSM 5388]SIO28123.1 dimethyladenosine transferase [Peptoclostridium litorale DSM 5388]